ncbi:MAG: NosR/NirI family protein [Xanthomonadales bacterium]|nr:NosR/NirI family protein [Xanthomonadales bacterium]
MTSNKSGFHSLTVVFFLVLVMLCSLHAHANQSATEFELTRFTDSMTAATIFPGAERYGRVLGGPPVIEILGNGKLLGYVFLNTDFVNSTGYSGKPIYQLIAMDTGGIIRQVLLVEHHEPIVLIGIPESRILAVLDKYVGLDIGNYVRDTNSTHQFDAVTGATVTVMVMDDTILRSAIKVARWFGLSDLQAKARQVGPIATINTDITKTAGWQTLIDEGSVARLTLSLADINAAFEQSGNTAAIARTEEGSPKDIFIDLYAAVVSVPTIGKSMLGEREYKNMLNWLEPNQYAIVLASNGRYSFKGSGYVRGGIFDRFKISQGDTTIRFHDYQHKRLRRVVASAAPDFKNVDIFKVSAEHNFNPAEPWQLELLVGRSVGPVEKVFLTFDLSYKLSEQYLLFSKPKQSSVLSGLREKLGLPEPTAEDAPLWMKMWLLKLPEVLVLLTALIALTVMFFFQDSLVKRPQLADRIRIGFLIFTLFAIGWYANAQLSVVNILAVFSALVSGFSWGYFLMEPLIFILWGAVAAALLFWGRGPYCGWLCPFGALQELLNRIAKRVKVPQLRLPWGLHERLWALKYLIFLVLLGFSFHSLAWAERLAEIEPFKTAIILKFMRDWPFVIFAIAVLLPGLFIERFYCRYLCPLGAALAIPGRLRMFSWLKRYKECGSPCQRCSNECMVQAIHPEGNINVNECMYCLHCQVVYYNDHACPVMIQKRLKRQRRQARVSKESKIEIELILAETKVKKSTKAS